jgi:antitoxin MazE
MIQQIRKIGNSNGIILPKAFLEALNIGGNVKLELRENKIVISPIEITSRDGWDEQFQNALNDGHLPENDLFEDLQNEFDTEEW